MRRPAVRPTAGATRALSIVVAVLAAMILPLATAAPAVAAPGTPPAEEPCTDTANVTWETDHPGLAVTGAVVEVPGCPDGARVGVQVTTSNDGTTEPIIGSVDDEQVRIDLTPFDLTIRPVVGVRVLLYGESPTQAGTGNDQPTDGNGTGGGLLPGTGATVTLLMIVVAVASVALGGGLLLARRSRQSAHDAVP